MKLLKGTYARYFVNKEKKTVTCILEFQKYREQNLVEDSIGLNSFFNTWSVTGLSSTATAKCSSEDVFDEVIGKKIALQKAKVELLGKLKPYFEKATKQMLYSIERSKKALEEIDERQKRAYITIRKIYNEGIV
jgi:hypothetical protein